MRRADWLICTLNPKLLRTQISIYYGLKGSIRENKFHYFWVCLNRTQDIIASSGKINKCHLLFRFICDFKFVPVDLRLTVTGSVCGTDHSPIKKVAGLNTGASPLEIATGETLVWPRSPAALLRTHPITHHLKLTCEHHDTHWSTLRKSCAVSR